MLKINDIANYLFSRYELINQEPWDNSGIFLNGFDFNSTNNVIIALDLTRDVIEIAKQNNANLIICHHPICLNDNTIISNDKQELINLLKENSIVFISLHTCYDKTIDGTSFQLIKNLPLVTNIKQNHECQYIFKADLKNEIELEKYVKLIDIKNSNSQKIIYDSSLKNIKINSISVCAGSGSFYVRNIINNKESSCYITGDLKWHNWLDANDMSYPLIDIGHSTEIVFIEHIEDILKKNFNVNTIKVFPKVNLISD